MIKIGLVFVVVSFLAGCASTAAVPVTAAPDPGLVALISVAEDVARSNREANALRSAGNNDSLAVQYDFAISGLPDIWTTEISLLDDWNGSLSGFLLVVSRMGGLDDPIILGSRPPASILIDIPRGRRTLVDFLADAGFQGGPNVTVSPLLKQNRVQILFKAD